MRSFDRLLHARSGNFGMMTALLLPCLILSSGVAIDTANIFSAKDALQNALDAAVLDASKLQDDEGDRQQAFIMTLKGDASNGSTLSNVSGSISFDRGANYLKANGTASADVKLVFLNMLHFKGPHVKVTAASYQSTRALEVAMVLDNTGSLGDAGIKAVRDAADSLTGILQTEAEKSGKSIKAALVPFVTAVNVKGDGFKDSWIDKTGASANNGVHFSGTRAHDHMSLFGALGVSWKGCVEARPGPYNLSDDVPNPAIPNSLFVPYFAPDEPGPATSPGNNSDKFNNSYLDDAMAAPLPSGASASVLKQYQQDTAKYYSTATDKLARLHEAGPLSNGPNRACPTPIVPLTDDFERLKTDIGRMNYWNGSGTNVSEGLMWGWRVLSPAEPYTGGAPFDSDGTTKAVVLFTDGDNVVFGASGEKINFSDYGAYGFLGDNRFGTKSQSQAVGKVNDYTKQVCSQLKDRGVDIYAVLLNADSASNRALYTACVSKPENYYPIASKKDLAAVFSKIGSQLTKLYLMR